MFKPIETTSSQYFTHATKSKIHYEMLKQPEAKPAFWRRGCSFYKEVDSFLYENRQHPVVQLISQRCLGEPHYEMVHIFELPEIPSPNKAALCWNAHKYAEKYSIEIYVLTISELAQKIPAFTERTKQETSSACIGFIVSEEITIDSGHVTPMLGFFTTSHLPQFLIMDVSSQSASRLANFLHRALPHEICRQNSFAYAPGNRQIDPFSCRTGALTLLRNALLSFRDSKNPSIYWKEVFQKASKEVPPEWTYVEQRQLLDETRLIQSIAIRDKFSKKQLKRLHPRTVAARIADKSEQVTLSYFTYCPYDEKFSQKSFYGLIAPKGSSLKMLPYGIVFEVSVKKTIYTYLIRKAFRNKKLAEEMDIC